MLPVLVISPVIERLSSPVSLMLVIIRLKFTFSLLPGSLVKVGLAVAVAGLVIVGELVIEGELMGFVAGTWVASADD